MMHFSTHDGRKQHITFDLNVPEIYVDPTIAIPLGLAINELISNSIKHAFPEKREGKISIRGEESNGRITLLVQDDGVGIPADVDWKNTQSLGLGLVIGLIDQIDGKIEKGPGPGTTFIITIDSKYTVSI
jgi:two-component sensor histidine kinase